MEVGIQVAEHRLLHGREDGGLDVAGAGPGEQALRRIEARKVTGGVIAGTLVENCERNHGIRGASTGSLYVLSGPIVPNRFPANGLCKRIASAVVPVVSGHTPGLSKECSMTHTPRLHRSELAVPGSNVRMLEKAPASERTS